MFAHCSTNLHWVQRAYPFSTAQLTDCELSIDFRKHCYPNDLITVIATKPLTSGRELAAVRAWRVEHVCQW